MTDKEVESEFLLTNEVAPRCREAGWLSLADLKALGDWKSRRLVHSLDANDDSFVRAVTRASLGTDHDRFRIESLLLLRGVGWPMASVILHWCSTQDFPILDYRAMRSLGEPRTMNPRYGFRSWQVCVATFRRLIQEHGVGARELDRALWAFDKIHHPRD